MSNIYKHSKTNTIGCSCGMQQLEQPKEENLNMILKSFLAVGQRSLAGVRGVYLSPESDESLVQDEWPSGLIEKIGEMGVKATKIRLDSAPLRQVVAIDTSSLIIAAGPAGAVVALRGALATRNFYGVRLEQVGPFIAYLTHDNLTEILASILGESMLLDYCTADYQLDGSIQKILAGLLEKKLQEYVAEKYRDSILLFDGSLSAGPLDNPLWLVSRILEKALPRGNDVLAFSKTSILQFLSNIFTDEKLEIEPPYIIDITWAIRSIEMRVKVLGDTYLAKLSNGVNAFRVDVSAREKAEDVLASLLKSDPLIYGYPELLIIAHDYCTFTKMDVIAIQSMLRRCGVEFFEASSIRDILFNPLDRRWRG
ncbi:MAG: DNA double-strand break repair nuclease NurA [Nitrososphaerota archaeon]|nr:DNA double-strand break repair nuclease NurA [Nitrososphaerota archaeon]